MTLFLNIANKPEVARRADSAVRGLLTALRNTEKNQARSDIILQSIRNWKAMFPRNANQAAVAAFTHALNMESGKGNGGVEVVECIRCLDLIANKAH